MVVEAPCRPDDGPVELPADGPTTPLVLGAQVGIVSSFLVTALIPEPLNHLSWLIAGCVISNAFIAFQDVAIDGMAVDVPAYEEQGQANGLMLGGQALGIAGSTAAGAWILRASGPSAMCLAAAAFFACCMLVPLLLRERPGERLLPWTPGRPSPVAVSLQLHGWRDIGFNLLRVVVLPASLLATLAMFSFRFGFGVLNAAVPVMSIQELGWTDTGYSQVRAIAELAGALIGMALGGVLIDRIGRVPMATAGGALAIALMLAMAWGAPFWSVRATIIVFVTAYAIVSTTLLILFAAIMMPLCGTRVAATQFGVYMAISNMGMSVGSGLFGPLRTLFSYPQLFYVAASSYGLMILLMRFVSFERHAERLKGMEPAMATVLHAAAEEPV